MPVLTCTLSLQFAIDMLKWLGCPSKNGPWCQQSISLDKLAIHVNINTAPSLGTDLPRPLSNNLWSIPSQKIDWDRLEIIDLKFT